MTARLLACVILAACWADEPDICPPDTPDFRPFNLTVTEGSSTVFPLYAVPGPLPDASVSGQIDTEDHSIATLSAKVFEWSSTDYPPKLTAFGVDDGVADSGARMTTLGGVVLDCGGGSIGEMHVVDRESLQVLASPWELELTPGTTAPLTVALTQAPPADVSVMLEPASGAMATVAPTSFVLGSDNWSTGVVATVTAIGSGHTAIAIDPGSDSGLATYYVAVDVDD